MVVAAARRIARKAIDHARYRGFRALSAISSGPLRGHRALQTSELIWRDEALFVAAFEQGEVFSDYGVILRDRILVENLSPMMGGGMIERHEALNKLELGKLTRLSGRVAVISSHAHQRYFHWMMDVLPRIEILRRSGVQFDRIIANTSLAYQSETLAGLGIVDVISPVANQRLRADRLLVPSLPGPLGVPSQFSIQFLRHAFGTSSVPHRKLYLSRGDAVTRRVANESELLADLPDFEVVLLDGMTVAQQAQLFAEALVVIGPHGAGFTNAIFMEPGTDLIEFMPDTYFNDCFEVIAEHLELNYHRVGCRSLGGPTHDIVIDRAILQELLATR